jgi:hypothetical protein
MNATCATAYSSDAGKKSTSRARLNWRRALLATTAAPSTGISLTSGLGIAEDLKSLMVFTDPSTVGLAGQGVVTKLPLCEDM